MELSPTLFYFITFLLVFYALSVIGATMFAVIMYDELRASVMNKVINRRLLEKKSLRLRWGLRNEIQLFIFMAIGIVCPICNTFLTVALFKVSAKGWKLM